MLELKNLLINSLSVSLGLFIYTIFIYIGYIVFFSEGKSDKIKEKDEEKEVKKEDIENFDILEDV